MDSQIIASTSTARLKPGDLVEVKSKDEILASLDGNGKYEGMPFMPEMLAYCGKQFRVAKRAEKSCDTVWTGAGRRISNTVHLEGVRCNGSSHGGCQALCLIWWREAWLRKIDGSPRQENSNHSVEIKCNEDVLQKNTTLGGIVSGTIYSCQMTRLLEFSRGHRWYDPRPVVAELKSGNVSWREAGKVIGIAALNMLRRRLGKREKPSIRGRCNETTPKQVILGLKPGDWVVVKSQEEIEKTLDKRQKNRALFFDIEMLEFCGRKMRLLQKVEKIIDERTGAMRGLPSDCWIIEGAYCSGKISRNRLFCTRQIYSYWREIWFEKVPDDQVPE